MWADWYTLLNAQTIFHTHSDFSRSAARWNENIQSWTILGSMTVKQSTTKSTTAAAAAAAVTTEPVVLLRKDKKSNGTHLGVPKLVDRGSKDLWFCGSVPTKAESVFLQEKRNRQLMDLIKTRKQQNFEGIHGSRLESAGV